MLRAIRNIMHGPVVEYPHEIRDTVSLWRKFPYALLLASLLLFGFVPSLLTNKIKPTAQAIVESAAPVKIQKAEKTAKPKLLQAAVK